MAIILLIAVLFVLVVTGVDGKIHGGGSGVIIGSKLLQQPVSVHFISEELSSSPRRIINRSSTIRTRNDWMSTIHQTTQTTKKKLIEENSSTRSEMWWRSIADNCDALVASAVSIIVQSKNSRSVLFPHHATPRGGGSAVDDDDDDNISNKMKGRRRRKRRYKPSVEEESAFLNKHGVDSSLEATTTTLSNNVDTALTFSTCSGEEEKEAPTVTKLSSNNGRRSRRKRKRRMKSHQLQQQKEEDVVVDNNDFFDFILSSSSSEDQSISSSAAVDYQAYNNGDIDNASINPSSEIDNRIMSSSASMPRKKSRKKRRQRFMPSSMAMTATDNINDNGDSKEGAIASVELKDTAIIASSTLTSQMEDAMFTDIFKHGEANEDIVITMITNKDDENADNIIMHSDSSIVLPESLFIPRDDVSNASSVIDDTELNIEEIDDVDDCNAVVEVKLDSIVESDEATISSFIIKGATKNVDADVSVLNEIINVVQSEPNSLTDGKYGIDDKGGSTNSPESVTVGESITLEEETFSTAAEMVDTIVASISKQQDDKCKSMNDADDQPLKEETNVGESLTLSIVTWNLGESEPSEEDASSFFSRFHNSDLVMIGAQECEDIKPRRTEGRRSRHFRRLSIMMMGENYVPLAIHSLGGIQSALYCHRNVLGEVDMISVADVTCGVGGVLHNKGAIGIYLKMKRRDYDDEQKSITKTSRILLVTGHLAAHVTNVDARNADYKRIVSELETQAPIRFLHPRRKNADGSLAECDGTHLLNSMDHVFFAGDLNYRIDLPREYFEQCIINIQRYRQMGAVDRANLLMKKLLRRDQLLKTIASGRAFTHFCEGKVTFLPTFKFDKGTSDYDTSHKQRIPAWTDRIVFRSNKVNVLAYDSAIEAKHSDHRPVFGTFRLGWGIKDTISVISKRKLKRAKSIGVE